MVCIFSASPKAEKKTTGGTEVFFSGPPLTQADIREAVSKFGKVLSVEKEKRKK